MQYCQVLVASCAWVYYVNHYLFIRSSTLRERRDLFGTAWINYGICRNALVQVQKLARSYRV
ncbi:hypothetical protein BDV38DRAFT_242879 [Aspergillus pseudotamarii]|uniref:Uncharacterized protein n=1 Tax=Aspergillus pseudotamarii TaxID=132259 RepID=A0A5N6SWZ7_ASPPS|nr:uncharacterized protein BDV38DRAFT_242879 [Aspergillus pseudotamarii]KAE8139142.1 hypothetical protein BDV38DRAFT_242879 [Aspergillus pseudotamarii]